ncbi:hypothetical protein F5Y13DRAFT_202695 [Hypoxylon sp. FL1857]|nr:hypothetical protein F5Y13DRAFT_202695 [Hypoxylon sp. FL1857]
MDSQKIQPQLSPEIPILGRYAKRIVEGIDNNSAFDDLFAIVRDMAKEMRNQQLIPINKVTMLFEDSGTKEYDQLRTLFHTLHPKMLRSLVLGMVPHDLSDKDSPNWRIVYDPSGSGTYLAGISIGGRNGAFLTCKEIDMVIQHMGDYKRGCEVWLSNKDAYGLSQATPEQQEYLKKALIIDNHIITKNKQWDDGDDYRQPICISGKDGTRNIDELMAMLRRRVNPNFDPDVPQLSSPAYVGCSHMVSKRMINHNPDFSNLLSSSNVWRLLIECIRHIGLRAIVHTIPIIMVWEKPQIRLSEVLVTVLSQSLISQNGLNVIQPGTSSSSMGVGQVLLDGTKEHVWVKRAWFTENLERSLAVRLNRDIYKDAFDKVQAQQRLMPDEELRSLIDDNEKAQREIESTRGKIVESIRNIEAQNETARQSVDQMGKFLRSSRGMFPDLSQGEDDE